MSMFIVDYAQMSRERALNDRISELESGLGSANTQLQNTVTAPVVVPTIGNRVRNGEFDFNDAVYISASYTGNADRPFGWYTQDSTVTTSITETVAATESARSIKLLKTGTDAIISLGTPNQLDSASGQFVAGDAGAKIVIAGAGAAGDDLSTTIATFVSATQVTLTAAASTAVSGRFFATYAAAAHSAWHKGQGNIWLGGIDALYAPIPKTLFYPGKEVFIVGKAKFNSDITRTALDPTWRLRLAIWDNTVGQQKIIEGAAFKVTGSVISGSGAATRHYIVKVITPTTVYYLSDVVSPLSIGSLPAVVPAGSAGAVGLSWPSFTDADAYEVYRSDDGTSLSDYYKLIRITNGDTTFIDQGGRPGSPFAFAAQVNPRAEVFVENFGTGIRDNWLVFKRMLVMPGGYKYSATTDKQYLRIDVVDDTDTPATMDDLTVLLDQIGAGLTKGGFDYALEDLQFSGNVVITAPDPSVGGSGGGGGGSGGRGEDPLDGGGPFLGF
jgi:hypothetical protein